MNSLQRMCIHIADVYGDLWSYDFDRWLKRVEIGSSSIVRITATQTDVPSQ